MRSRLSARLTLSAAVRLRSSADPKPPWLTRVGYYQDQLAHSLTGLIGPEYCDTQESRLKLRLAYLPRDC